MFKVKNSLILMFTILLAFALIFPLSLQADTYIVPDDNPTIQGAINACTTGNDTVIVKPGWYGENLILKNGVKVLGQGWSNTYLYGNRTGNVVYAEDANAQIDGFTIYGSSKDPYFAGIKISGGSVVVSNNRIVLNTIGIYITGGSNSIIINNLLYSNGNTVTDYGIYCENSNSLITNNQINRNYGGGVHIEGGGSSGTEFINNTVVDNDEQGIWCHSSSPMIRNNIFTVNSKGISAGNGANPQIFYNCVYNNPSGNYDGTALQGIGDISEDPKLLGHYYKGFYLDANSPCIDAGDPDPFYNDTDGSRNDMGATGGFGGVRHCTDVGEGESGFLFTSIGKIPTSEITKEGLAEGLVNVSGADCDSGKARDSELDIPCYSNTPFGGIIWLNGQFGYADPNVQYYQILIAEWNGSTEPDPNDPNDFEPLKDPLYKIKYEISGGKVFTQRIFLGPLPHTTPPGLYERTNIGYWSHPDLKLRFNTRNLPNGKYDLICKAYNGSYGEENLPWVEDYNPLTIVINNSNVDSNIHRVAYDPNDTIGIEECAIITLFDPSDILHFTITAWHPDGFLKNYRLRAFYGRNRVLGNICNDVYDPNNYDPNTISWYGVSSEIFDSSSLPDWVRCAYQFELCAWARITNGFHYIYGRCFRDHYYITF